MNTVFKISGKEVDLGKSLPLTIGDMRKLKKDYAVDLSKLDGGVGVEDISSLLYYLCHKSNAEITLDDIDNIPSSWLQKIMEIFQALQQQVDPPF